MWGFVGVSVFFEFCMDTYVGLRLEICIELVIRMHTGPVLAYVPRDHFSGNRVHHWATS